MIDYILQSGIIDWKSFWLGSEEWSFLLETLLRSIIMFIVIVTSLRLLGKRGVKQLSVFELVVIISLGSAAGDPMFYKDVGLLPALLVFLTVILLYRTITYFIGKSKRFETLLEGDPVCLIDDGVFTIKNFEKELLAYDEFFAELRQQGVMHLGQIKLAIIETSGNISIFFYEDDEVKMGLPILPALFSNQLTAIPEKAFYSCIFCAHTQELGPAPEVACPSCSKKKWVRSIDKKRVS